MKKQNDFLILKQTKSKESSTKLQAVHRHRSQVVLGLLIPAESEQRVVLWDVIVDVF